MVVWVSISDSICWLAIFRCLILVKDLILPAVWSIERDPLRVMKYHTAGRPRLSVSEGAFPDVAHVSFYCYAQAAGFASRAVDLAHVVAVRVANVTSVSQDGERIVGLEGDVAF